MWRSDFRKYVCAAAVKRCAALMRLGESELLDILCQSHLTFSVGDYLFLDPEEIGLLRPLYWLSDGYGVTSPRLFDIYGGISDYPKPAALILEDVARGGLTEETLKQIADHQASGAAMWRRFFEDVVRKAHPDAPNWRRFMIDKFFLSTGEP